MSRGTNGNIAPEDVLGNAPDVGAGGTWSVYAISDSVLVG